MYLRARDYVRQIQSDNLNAIIGNDTSVRLLDEMAAQAEVISYLVQRYDTEIEFTDTTIWSRNVSYKALQRFYLDYDVYAATTNYITNDLVTFANNCYICTGATTGTFDVTKWTLLGAQYDMFYGTLPKEYYSSTNQYLQGNEVFYKNKTYTARQSSIGILPNDVNYGYQYWGNGTAYSINSGTLPTDATKFTTGDNRSQQLVLYTIDVALYHIHSRISPRNIPQLRIDRYDSAIAWLKEAGGQANAITANIPKLVPNKGMRTIFGGHPKKNNTY